MKEALLQFIWKFQYFNLSHLTGVHGERLEIVHPGTQNFNQGPDFLNAKIRINNTLWVGNIELHIQSGEWEKHNHQRDKNYSNVILHVVWDHDKDIQDSNGNEITTLVLEQRVSRLLLNDYQSLMEREQLGRLHFIPCEAHLINMHLDDLKLAAWKSRLVAERLTKKSKKVFGILEKTAYHWDEMTWQMTAANFGGNMNSQFFHRIAESVPQKILAKHKNQLITIEAILFGQASLLNDNFNDPYPQLLQREYHFYQTKYHLPKVDGNVLFGRMRPANFPTIRIAQLAALVFKSSHLFSNIKEFASVKEVKEYLRVEPNDFWLYHYQLSGAAKGKKAKSKALGDQMIENLIINTICPILFAYGIYQDDQDIKEKAIEWMEGLAPESNKITRGFAALGIRNDSAFDSQALLHLKKNYCDERRCLECMIGNTILKTSNA